MENIESIKAKINLIKAEILQEDLSGTESLEAFRIKYLGTKGLLKNMMGGIKDLSPDNRKDFGLLMNEFKLFIENHYSEKQALLDAKVSYYQQVDDYTLPPAFTSIGTIHPLTLVKNKIVSIFQSIGFNTAEGPEIEDDWHNFGAMNLPEDHPARDMQDTFYINQQPDWILRPHTSSVQSRVMSSQNPPIRIICPGRVYRNETISARAHCFFHQIEGLYVAEKVSFADLKQALYFFVHSFFGNDVKIRFRPSYFPFTEPSAEMDISCQICFGKGCNICKHTGWVEILGSGMVHPKVLLNFDIDPARYSGFAFGMGIERICQLKFRINDLRLYSQNDIRFLKQFEGVVL